MTIRYLLALTAVIAAVCAIAVINWAVAVFLSTCLAAFWVWRLNPKVHAGRYLQRAALLSIATVVYACSIGPAVCAVQFRLDYDYPSTAPWQNAVIETVFAPQVKILEEHSMQTTPKYSDALHTAVGQYAWKWRCAGWSARSFVNALLG